jgi:hypothetical protein
VNYLQFSTEEVNQFENEIENEQEEAKVGPENKT